MPTHTHEITVASDGSHNHSYSRSASYSKITDNNEAGKQTLYKYGAQSSQSTGSGGEHSHAGTAAETGEGLVHENMPPYYALAYIMKL